MRIVGKYASLLSGDRWISKKLPQILTLRWNQPDANETGCVNRKRLCLFISVLLSMGRWIPWSNILWSQWGATPRRPIRSVHFGETGRIFIAENTFSAYRWIEFRGIDDWDRALGEVSCFDGGVVIVGCCIKPPLFVLRSDHFPLTCSLTTSPIRSFGFPFTHL